jgi:hypothetical protein
MGAQSLGIKTKMSHRRVWPLVRLCELGLDGPAQGFGTRARIGIDVQRDHWPGLIQAPGVDMVNACNTIPFGHHALADRAGIEAMGWALDQDVADPHARGAPSPML